MPIAIVLMAVNVAFVIHAAKTGRFTPWGYVIFLLPGIGAIAYVLVELIPEWMGTYKGQQARKRVVSTLNPEKEYRRLEDELAITDTIANRSALAQECLELGKFDEALVHYDNILSRPMGEEPAYALGKARAEFGFGRPQAAVATLDDLRRAGPIFNPPTVICSMPARWRGAGASTRRWTSTRPCRAISREPRRACAGRCCWNRSTATPRPRRSTRNC